MQPFLDAAAPHRALLVLNSNQACISSSLHVHPPAKQTMESESGEKPFGKAALREGMMNCHWILAIRYGISEGSKTEVRKLFPVPPCGCCRDLKCIPSGSPH